MTTNAPLSRVVLAAGGTGGHIFPALAVAEEIKHRNPDAEVLFMGGNYGPEGEWARKAGLTFQGLEVRGVVGRGMQAPAAVWKILKAVLEARKILKEYNPQVVAGFGGYAGFAPTAAAVFCGIPRTVHEQNSIPGRTNAVLGKFAHIVFITYEDKDGVFSPKKSLLTGNPVRRDIAAVGTTGGAPSPTKRLLVLGGSQGAKAINEAVVNAAKALGERGIEIYHQAGAALFEETKAAYAAAGVDNVRVEPFIDDMAEAYAWADLVLCRAGATTAAELTAAGRAGVLVPFPYAAGDHQTVNAKRLTEAGAAVMLSQSMLEQLDLAEFITGMFGNPDNIKTMALAAGAMGKPDAAARIVDGLEELAAEKGR